MGFSNNDMETLGEVRREVGVHRKNVVLMPDAIDDSEDILQEDESVECEEMNEEDD